MDYNIFKKIKSGIMIQALCLGLLTGCGDISGAQVPVDGSAAAQQEFSGQEQAGYGQALAEKGRAGGQQLQASGEDISLQPPGNNPDGGNVDELEVHFIDVGQGDATLVKCGGQALLIDTGEADKGTAVQNYLKKQGVEKLDYLILTHPDADHIGAAPVILTKFQVGQVFMSNFEKDNNTYRKLIQALDDKRLKPVTPEAGSTVTLGSSVCTFLAPLGEYDDPNNASVAVLIQNGDNRFLFTGDGQEEAEADILSSGQDIHADVYKAGHHGSRTSSGEAFLDAVEPVSVVISCGEDNSYGHPHAATLNQLRARGIQVYRTDDQGSIIAWSDGSAITWNTAPSDSWKAGEPVGGSQTGEASGTDGTYPTGEASGTDVTHQTGEASGTDGTYPAGEASGTDGTHQTGEASGTDGTYPAGEASGTDGANQTGGASQVDEAADGEEREQEAPGDTGYTYVLNMKTMKFHLPDCSYLPTANRKDTGMSREEIIAQGYEPCKKCNP